MSLSSPSFKAGSKKSSKDRSAGEVLKARSWCQIEVTADLTSLASCIPLCTCIAKTTRWWRPFTKQTLWHYSGMTWKLCIGSQGVRFYFSRVFWLSKVLYCQTKIPMTLKLWPQSTKESYAYLRQEDLSCGVLKNDSKREGPHETTGGINDQRYEHCFLPIATGMRRQ